MNFTKQGKIENIKARVFKLIGAVSYQNSSIVSREVVNKKTGTGQAQVANATLESDIIYQKKGVAYGPASQVKY